MRFYCCRSSMRFRLSPAESGGASRNRACCEVIGIQLAAPPRSRARPWHRHGSREAPHPALKRPQTDARGRRTHVRVAPSIWPPGRSTRASTVGSRNVPHVGVRAHLSVLFEAGCAILKRALRMARLTRTESQ